MQTDPIELKFAVDLGPGEHMHLPAEVTELVGPGRWLLTLTPLTEEANPRGIRSHSAFLNSYAPQDDGLYDDCAPR
jgi:hypothetical protein